jgi:hypothetical protein
VLQHRNQGQQEEQLANEQQANAMRSCNHQTNKIPLEILRVGPNEGEYIQFYDPNARS